MTATYRFGIGQEGEVGAGAIALLKTRPPGVRSVINPLPASGAADPETLESARANAPQTVLTLDRIVSLQDFTDFAAAFAGIGKAQASAFRRGEQLVVHLTLASASGKPITPSDPLFASLRNAIDAVRDPTVVVELTSFISLTFRLKATVRYDARYLAPAVETAIAQALFTAFSFSQRDFAQPVTAAEVIAVMQSQAGVIAIDLDQLAYTSGRTGAPCWPPPQRGRRATPSSQPNCC